MAPKKKKCWRYSKGKGLLLSDLRDGTIPDNEHYKEVFKRRPEFGEFPLNNPTEALRLFEGRLREARKKVAQKNSRAAQEEAMFRADRLVKPASTTDAFGRPRWNGSAVQKLLKSDITAKKHIGLSTKQFHQTRPEYLALPRDFFGQKIQQEERLQKFVAQYGDRHNYY